MINLLLLALIDTQLRKVKKTNTNAIIIIERLLLVVLIDDFYQFILVLGKAFWDKTVGRKELHGKSFWSRFTSILTLIEQICQKINLSFQEMLKRAWDGKLDSRDVIALNQRLAIEFPTLNALDTDVMVQKKRLIILSTIYKLKNLHV